MCVGSGVPKSPSDALPRAGIGKRVHAWLLAHYAERYEQMVAARKRTLFADLSGSILEIGPGAGPNLAYYPKGSRWIGVEPNPYMHPYLRQAAERAGLSIEIRTVLAERLPAEDASVDFVVSTLVLCSVSDPARVLQEVRRVLRPDGRFVFLEHVAAEHGTRLRAVQRTIRPLWKFVADGCHLDRETGPLIEQAGFAQTRYDSFRLPLGPVSTQIAGCAIR
jgi:SAM-dependent methyltransferase